MSFVLPPPNLLTLFICAMLLCCHCLNKFFSSALKGLKCWMTEEAEWKVRRQRLPALTHAGQKHPVSTGWVTAACLHPHKQEGNWTVVMRTKDTVTKMKPRVGGEGTNCYSRTKEFKMNKWWNFTSILLYYNVRSQASWGQHQFQMGPFTENL